MKDDIRRAVSALGCPAETRVTLRPYIPYEQILPLTSCLLTNGGYTGVTLALAHGKPVVQCGRSEEKREIGARIEWSGAGRRITRRATPTAIARTVDQVLSDPHYRLAAARIARGCAGLGGAEAAVQLLLRLMTTRQPVHRT